MRFFPRGLAGNFLKSIWKGMGPDPTKRTIKSPRKEGTVSRKDIREAARKVIRRRNSR